MPYHKPPGDWIPHLDEPTAQAKADKLAKLLGLVAEEGLYHTSRGPKTPIGLARIVLRVFTDNQFRP